MTDRDAEEIERLKEEDVVLKLSRDRYVAYVTDNDRLFVFDVLHKHDHEDVWRSGRLERKAATEELKRFSYEIVPTDDTPFVEEL